MRYEVAELIAEAGSHTTSSRAWEGTKDLLKRLATALEAAEEEIQRQREINSRAELQTQAEEQRCDALAAVVESVRAARSNHPACDRHADGDPVSCGWKAAVLDIDGILDAAPADVLREHDAALIEVLAGGVDLSAFYPSGLSEFHNAEAATEAYLRERARERREGRLSLDVPRGSRG